MATNSTARSGRLSSTFFAPAHRGRPSATATSRWRQAWTALLVALLGATAAHAAVPVAAPAEVWLTDRYLEDTASGPIYRLPIDLLAFASDADGDALAFSHGEPSAGNLLSYQDGLVVFVISAADLAIAEDEATFEYTVGDGSTSTTATVRITLASADGPPTGIADAYDIERGVGTLLTVLTNDIDAETIAGIDLTGTEGTVTITSSGTEVVYTTPADAAPIAEDSFTYTPANAFGEGAPTLVEVSWAASLELPLLEVYRHWDGAKVARDSSFAYPKPGYVDNPNSARFDLHNPTEQTLYITNAATAISGECFGQVIQAEERVPGSVPALTVPPPDRPDGEPGPGFRLKLDCSTAGTKTAVVTLETEGEDGTVYEPFTFTVTAEVVDGPAPATPLLVRQNWDGELLTNGATFPYPNDAIFEYPTSFAIILENPGTEAIEITNAASAISGRGYWPLPGAPIPAVVGPGESVLFRVQLHWDAPETIVGTVTLETASSSQTFEPFVFEVTATLEIPEFEVFRGWETTTPIAEDEVVELPTVAAAGDAFHSAGFQIRNTGDVGTLVVTNPDASLVDGGCFEVRSGGFPDELVPVTTHTAFRVWWGGSCAPGTYTADVWVWTNSHSAIYSGFDRTSRHFTIVGRIVAVPELTCQPADTRVVAGDPVTLSVCLATEDPAFTYTWFKDGQPIAGTGPTLSIAAVGAADEGSYHVEVAGELGTVTSSAATLTVVEKPVVSRPVSQTVGVGGTATFSVTVSSPAEDGPFGFFWQSRPVGAEAFQTIPGATTDTLTVSGVTVAMDGTRYRCLVGNDAGQTNSSDATLTVVDAPTITSQPQSQRVVVGSNVTLSVTADGNPAPTFQWRRNGVTIAGATSPTLSLPSVSEAEQGTYRVRVTNSQGWVDSASAVVTVVERPVVSRPAHQTVAEGSTATFSVTVSSPAEDGPFTYRWQQLPPGASAYQNVQGATSATLSLPNVTRSLDGTRYRCLVSNDAGQTNSGYGQLTVETPDVLVTRDYDDATVAQGSVYDFGIAERSVTTSVRFRIYNTGQGTLSLTNRSALVSGACWGQIETPTATVAPGAYANFRVRLYCHSTGVKTGTVTIQSNDPSTPYTFTVRGTVVASDLTVKQNWDGATVAPGSTQLFPTVDPGESTSRRYQITNSGQATLTLNNRTALVSGSCWSQIETPSVSIAPGATAFFRVRLLCSSSGTKTGTVTIQSNDPTSPYTFNLQGTVRTPQPPSITVTKAWNTEVISEGSTFAFPNVDPGVSVSRAFRITNHGPGTLTIANSTSFVSGTCWSQIESPSSSIPEGGNDVFRVRLLCSSSGSKSGTVRIYSNEGGSPFTFYLQGTVN